MYANAIGYSDVTPFEIIRTVSDKCLEVREMRAAIDPTWQAEWHAGGFAGHCANQGTQRWLISSNDTGRIVRIRRQKDGQWKSAHGERFRLSDNPIRFYDFNF